MRDRATANQVLDSVETHGLYAVAPAETRASRSLRPSRSAHPADDGDRDEGVVRPVQRQEPLDGQAPVLVVDVRRGERVVVLVLLVPLRDHGLQGVRRCSSACSIVRRRPLTILTRSRYVFSGDPGGAHFDSTRSVSVRAHPFGKGTVTPNDGEPTRAA